MCEFAEQGLMPVSGAVLEQTQSFLDALRFYRGEVAACKAVYADVDPD